MSKGGWQYLWLHYQPTVDTAANAYVHPPDAVYVEQVYDSASFALLGIGS